MSAALDAAIGDPYYDSSVLSIPDQLDAAKMAPFSPDQSVPWWQNVVQYGITRAIDNRYGPQNLAGNTQAGSYQGAGGRSQLNNPSAGAAAGLMPAGGGMLTLLALAALVYVIAKG